MQKLLRLSPVYLMLLAHAFVFLSYPSAKSYKTKTGLYVEKLKFVNAVTHQDITSITINTDQDITVMVMGVLSTDPDTSHWIDVTGLWTLSPDVFGSSFPLPPLSSDQWHFSPGKPGGPSNLTVTTGAGATLKSATIPVIVTSAPPSSSGRVFFNIITPPDSIFAGVPFRAVVSICNKDGLMPGQYCYPANSGSNAIYQDSLGKGSTPDPTVITSCGSGTINQAPDQTSQVAECFINGLDTISITLYRAPYHNITDLIDTMHQLVVILGPLSVTTGPFKLLPCPQLRMQLESGPGKHLTGTDTLTYPAGAITVYSIAYDMYGNKCGRMASNWSVTGNLHQPFQTAGISQVYYDASQATGDERGLLIARSLRSAVLNDSTSDSIGIFIKGPPVVIDSAVTRDIVHASPFVSTMQSYKGFFITFGGYSQTQVSVKIYSIKGQLLQTISGTGQGNGLILWNYSDKFDRPVTSGCYILRIFAGSENVKRKIFLSR